MLTCSNCGKIFNKPLSVHNQSNKRKDQHSFCSIQCVGKSRIGKFQQKRIIKPCLHCGKLVSKILSQAQKTPNFFCNCSCAATYNNTHKTKGNRRSRLEKFIEEQLSLIFPDLLILYNNKDTINSELDIYVPLLSLAFELNGIFHYEPIYGQKKLASIQNNDKRKIQACLEQKIELCIIDATHLKYFKPEKAQKYLNIVTSLIHQKISQI